jgi:hypothetical protein
LGLFHTTFDNFWNDSAADEGVAATPKNQKIDFSKISLKRFPIS